MILNMKKNIHLVFGILFLFASEVVLAQTTLLEARKKQIQAALASEFPVITYHSVNLLKAGEAQLKLIKDPRLKDFFYERGSGAKMLCEVFSVSMARASDVSQFKIRCLEGGCLRIELFNFALNSTILAFVDNTTMEVLTMSFYKDIQPDIPPYLVNLAMEIAKSDPEVKKELGVKIDSVMPLMPGTKTALNRTKCQRSKHLCVAPTFIKEDKALWAIVDLTDLNVAGVKWTNVGLTGMAVTERTAQNSKVMDCFCDIDNKIERQGWQFSYAMTRSDGLQVTDIFYNGIKLFNSVKLVDWHVAYSKTEGFGYSDGIGCPEFSTAAVLAVEPPYFEPIMKNQDTIGFRLGQRYYSEGWPTACNYNYHQYFEFYNDGRFRPVAGSIGRGCGNNGMYRPVTRIAFAPQNANLFEWKNDQWQHWNQEQWTLQKETSAFKNGNLWFRMDAGKKLDFEIFANTGQFPDGGKGDNAFVFATRQHSDKDEGDIDLPTIGPCCNTDYHQGPEKFIEPQPEPLKDAPIVVWYVAQIENDDTKGKEYCWAESILENGVYKPIIFPCYSGPMIKPILK